MNYLDALRAIHATVRPAAYLEIGCRKGASLELAECPRLAIDPEPEITTGLRWPTRIYRETSDAFFARPDAARIIGAAPDLAFIDGMHLVEFALRDFINVEAHAHDGTLVVIDDVAPGDIAWASRERETKAWTGDVYRLIPLLRHYRPDLDIQVFDADIVGYGKGLAVIGKLDPRNTALSERYDDIEKALEDGAFTETTTDGIRSKLDVRPADGLAAHLAQLTRRAAAQTAADTTHPATGHYLDLMKKALLNELYREDEFRLFYLRRCLAGRETFDAAAYHDLKGAKPRQYSRYDEASTLGRPFRDDISNLAFTHSMMGRARMDNLHEGLDHVRRNNIAGDVMECGVWRGGACIFMAAYLQAHGMAGRKVLVADSFEGLPKPRDKKDAGIDLHKDKFPQLAVPQRIVRENFAAYDLLAENVVFLEGWFCDTLRDAPTDRIALLRLDGDLYSSTMDILEALYDKVEDGGVIIVDDYKLIASCKQAVDDFFAARGTPSPEVTDIDWTGVYWIKQTAR